MQQLYVTYKNLIRRTPTTFVRSLHDRISWQARLVGILGSRGVGKTTLMLQHIKLYDNPDESLYVFADDFYFSTHRLFDLALDFSNRGGRTLYVDEIHCYPNWSRELKNIYDQIPDLRVVYSGSSILALERGGGDLSRRQITYVMPGLSFREYVNMSQGLSLPILTLDEVLAGKLSLPEGLKPLKLFADYLTSGFFPFFAEPDYHERLRNVIKLMVEVDIPTFAELGVASAQKLKKLLYVLAQSVPFKPNYAKLERDLEISRNTLPTYMLYLEKAGLISLLREKAQGIKILEKVEKVYLANPNMAYVLASVRPDIGTVRETTFFAWLREVTHVTASDISDFEIDGRTFEIGGKTKSRRQIVTAKEGYVVRDDTEYAFDNIIPLYSFGFLY